MAASAPFSSSSSSSVLRQSSSSSSTSLIPLSSSSSQPRSTLQSGSRFNGKRLVLRTTMPKGHRRLSSRGHAPTFATSVAMPSINGGITRKTNSVSSPIDDNTNPRDDGSRLRDDREPQELTVYEFNEQDRNSPLLLPLNKPGFDMQRLRPVASLGTLVAFTNKLFDGSLKKRLGITAGVCMVIRYNQQKGGCLYEATYSFYFGDLGHISVQGPYAEYEETTLAITGGTGIFMGVYGTVRLRNVKFPTSLFYRFKLYGIPKLPAELIWDTVPPTEDVKPAPNASSPGVALRNFTD